MDAWNYVFIVLGAVCLVYGVVLTIMRQPNKSKLKDYTEESLTKFALVEGIVTMITGVSVLVAGLAYNAAILPSYVAYIGVGMIFVCFLTEFIVEGKMLVKKEKESVC